VPGWNILVVEDDPLLGMLLVDVLVGMGHEVCGLETNAADAVRGAASWQPDLLLVDMRLGAGSGIDAVTAIRSTRPIPYLYMTGGDIPVGGPDDIVLSKPFMAAELRDAIERVLACSGGGLGHARAPVVMP
jgi:CheY-like chemotaxis protein